MPILGSQGAGTKGPSTAPTICTALNTFLAVGDIS